MGPILATAERLGVLDAAGETLRALVQGRRVDAARVAWRAAKFAAARLAVERMR
jgi:hypothetical protein